MRAVAKTRQYCVLNRPALLVLNCLEYWAATKQECYQPPVRSLVFSKEEYSLGAIIYGEGAHFCCHIFVQGGVLFYDGMAKRKLSWGNTQSVNIPTGFIINQMWYVRHNGGPGQTLGSFPCAIASQISHDTSVAKGSILSAGVSIGVVAKRGPA